MTTIPIVGSSNLHRDMRSHGIINTDSSSFQQAKIHSERAKSLKQRVDTLEQELELIKSKLGLIENKTMVFGGAKY